jgi:hypothetical protein
LAIAEILEHRRQRQHRQIGRVGKAPQLQLFQNQSSDAQKYAEGKRHRDEGQHDFEIQPTHEVK